MDSVDFVAFDFLEGAIGLVVGGCLDEFDVSNDQRNADYRRIFGTV